MTLTTLSSKEFKTLFKWAFRRNRTIMIIFSIILGLGLVLNVYAMAIEDNYSDNAVPVTIIAYESAAAFFTFVSALKTFSFLHNKRSVDMFGALPTDRPTMFISHLLAGISSIVIPFTIGSVIITGMASRSSDTFKLSLFMIFTSLIMIAAAYTFTSLIAYCCGTAVDTAIVTIAANGIWVGIIALYFGIVSDMIPGFSFENIIYSPMLSALAPYGFSIADVIYYYEASPSATIANIVWQLIFTAGIFVLTIYVCRKRKAESSQNGFAFGWLPMVIKAGASIVAGAFIGFIAAETAYSGHSNMYIFAFWYVVIGFVAFFVLHIIFSRGLKGKFVPQAIVYGGTTVAVLMIVFSMSYGFGLDTYVPNPDTIKEVSFDYVTFKEPENIKLVTEIHQVITEGVRDKFGYPYFIGEEPYNDYYDGYTNTTNSTVTKDYYFVNSAAFNFEYKRKLGFATEREYYLYSGDSNSRCYDLEKLNDLVGQLYATEEYKTSLYEELFDEEIRKNTWTEAAEINYMVYTSENYSTMTTASSYLPNDRAFFDGFAQAYKKDILADDNLNRSADSVIGEEFISITFHYYKNERIMAGSNYYTYTKDYIVKNSYKNTLDFLERNDISKTAAASTDYFNPNTYDSELYYDGYVDFGYNGEYTYLQNFITEVAPNWEYSCCKNAGVEDYTKWHQDNYTAYLAALKAQARKLYDEYSTDSSYYDPSYTNDYLRETGDSGEYFMLEDAIIEELKVYSDDYIMGTLKNGDDKSSDSEKSDIDRTTDTDTESKAETSSDTDTNTNTDTVSQTAI